MVILATCISTVAIHTPPFLPTGYQRLAAKIPNTEPLAAAVPQCTGPAGGHARPQRIPTDDTARKGYADLLSSQYSRKINWKLTTLDMRTYL